uniref:HMA domain-containing protein n=1 Tax=Leersia perrieri TaxID=77586 RepID=A0A0D9W4G4_9ORYZ
MPTLIITVDLQCCRCSTKIQKILCCMQERGEFEIEKIVYKKETVEVSGPFDAEKLYCKLWCKASKIIKDIKIKPPPPPEEKKPKTDDKKDEDKKPDKPKPKPDPPCKLIFPYMYPPHQYCPTWPCGCPTQHCECHSKPPPPAPTPPPPPPEPTKPACGCHGCSPPYPPYMAPYPPMVVCEENPNYGACTIM